MDAWDAALQFLLIGDRARKLAHEHPLQPDRRCARCGTTHCIAAELAVEALAVLRARDRDRDRDRDRRVAPGAYGVRAVGGSR
jgi:hypothetical protein